MYGADEIGERCRGPANPPLDAPDRHPQRHHQPHGGRLRHRQEQARRPHQHHVAQRRRRGRAVLRGVRGVELRERQPFGQPDAADDRHGAARHRGAISERFRAGGHGRRYRAHPQAGQDRRADGDRGRPCHRGQSAPAARLLRSRHPLHDADAHQYQQLGGFVGRRGQGRRGASQRADAVRQAGGARDEPAGDDGRHFARRRQDFLGRAGGEHGADLRVAFVVPGAVQRAAQYDGRNDCGARQEGRRDTDQFQLRVFVGEVGRGGEDGAGQHAAGRGGRGRDHRGISQEGAAGDARRRGGAHRSCGEDGRDRCGGNRQRFRWRVLHAGGARGCFEVSESDACAAGEGLFGGGYSEDLWREHAAGDAGGGGGGEAGADGDSGAELVGDGGGIVADVVGWGDSNAPNVLRLPFRLTLA